MFKSKVAISAIAAAVVAICGSLAHAQEIQNAVVTVGQMMKIDNAQALARAQEEAVKSGILTGPRGGAKKEEVPLPVWSVRAVYGIANTKFADLRVDSVAHSRIAVGHEAAMCRVDDIQNECVKLAPKTKNVRKGSCPPFVCWNGDEIAAEFQAKQSKAADTSYRLSPVPSRPIPLPQASPAGTAGQ